MKSNIFFVLGLLITSFFVVFLVFAYNPGTDFTLCTGSFESSDCTLDWTITGSSSQTYYEVQIDQNQNFNNILLDTGWVNSSDKFYVVDSTNLEFNKDYYWRVRIIDNYDSESSWVAADSTFQISITCPGEATATDLDVSSHSSATYCESALHNFSWDYTGGSDQSRFQLQVDDDSGFSSPEVDRDYTGLSNPSPTTNNQVVYVSSTPTSDRLEYNKTYYWRVKVYDSSGGDSGWVSGSSFSTADHSYPLINYTWDPRIPSVEDEVQFIDSTTCSAGCSSWSWAFSDGTPSSSSSQNPIVQFSSEGTKQIDLQVADSSGYSCSLSQDVDVASEVPEYREILPE